MFIIRKQKKDKSPILLPSQKIVNGPTLAKAQIGGNSSNWQLKNKQTKNQGQQYFIGTVHVLRQTPFWTAWEPNGQNRNCWFTPNHQQGCSNVRRFPGAVPQYTALQTCFSLLITCYKSRIKLLIKPQDILAMIFFKVVFFVIRGTSFPGLTEKPL